jgi:hypothetical protein
MRLQQATLVPVPTPVEGLYISSRSKITKGGLRQAQARYKAFKTTAN